MSNGSTRGGSKRLGPERKLHGILVVDKPAGITSMEVVRRVKRASPQKRVGHGGTLDPVATGVLPVCLVQSTRIMGDLIEGTKEYRAVVELGTETDTYDSLGKVVATGDPSSVTLEKVEKALDSFKGKIQQIPPMYSALKKQGKRLYDLARAGIEVEREPRTVEVFRLDLLDWSPPRITLDAICGRGLYMRSLAHDLGQVLGCGGHLQSLRRHRTGPFHIGQALQIEEAEQVLADDAWDEVLHAPDTVLASLRATVVGNRTEDMIRNGRQLPVGLRIPISRPDERIRAYGVDGSFIGIIKFNASSGKWQPEKVFALGYPDD